MDGYSQSHLKAWKQHEVYFSELYKQFELWIVYASVLAYVSNDNSFY